jgi:ELWxxDGT repeat protein
VAKGRLLGAAGGRLLFTAQERGGFEEPAFWLSGGTGATTFQLDTDGRSLEVFSPTVAAGGLHYFEARKIGSGEPLQLWRTDGSTAGTFAVARLTAAAALAPWQGGLTFFDADAIWQTDGTVAGTVKTGDFPSDLRAVRQAVPGPGGLYLLASSGNGASHVWITDGSTAGTRQLTSPTENGSAGGDPQFTPIGSTVYFYWLNGLWKTDGTAAGTVRFHSLPGAEIAVDLAPLQGQLVYLTADFSPATAVHLWRSDGTPDGTVQLAAFPGQDVFADKPVHLVPLAGRLYFGIDDRAHGTEPWATDGTAEGTALALDLVPGAGSSLPREMTVMGGRMYFAAADPRHGREIWVSDGTASGTRLVQDIAPQAGSSSPEQLTLLVEYTVTVTDTQTGEVRTYRNPSGHLASVADTAAF